MLHLFAAIILAIAFTAMYSSAEASNPRSKELSLVTSNHKIVITSVFPDAGPVYGGTPIVLVGGGSILFNQNNLTCRFQDVSPTVTESISVVTQWISSTEITCVSPQWNKANVNTYLTLELDGIEFTSSPSFFFYYANPVIVSIYPSFGSLLGGTIVRLQGSGFLPLSGALCRFGTIDVSITWNGYNEVLCTSPLSTTITSVALSFSLNGIDLVPNSTLFRYTEAPVIYSLSPTSGSMSGGYALSINGRGFEDTSYLKCVFRGLNDTSTLSIKAQYFSPNKVTCITPQLYYPAHVLVHVTVNGVDTSFNGIKFEYLDHAKLSSAKPSCGPTSGGTKISLYGVGFVDADTLRCDFGMKKVLARRTSVNVIECESPAQRNGPSLVNITLTLNGLKFSSNELEFHYYNLPTLLSVHPTIGTTIGGTSVIVHGSQFISSPDILCRFGVVEVIGYYIQENKISCHSPPGAAESSHLISISLNGVDFVSSSISYRFVDPEVESVTPRKGYIFGGTKLRIVGTGFEDTEELICVFDNFSDDFIFVKAEYISSTAIECMSPRMSHPGQTLVKVSLNGVDTSYSSAVFDFVSSAVISSLVPSSGPEESVLNVYLIGIGFLDGPSTCCRIRDAIISAEWISSSVILCKLSALNQYAGYASVSYSNDGKHFINADSQFLFLSIPTVMDVYPTYGLRSGGTDVRILADEFINISEWKCAFGNISVPAIFNSLFELNCRSPAFQEDRAPLRLLLEDHGLNIDTGVIFSFIDKLRVVSTYPDSAPVLGGTSVLINVQGLREDTYYVCTFGNEHVPAEVVNSTSIQCETPPWYEPEETTLAVHSDDISMVFMSDLVTFSFYLHPKVISASPTIFYVGSHIEIFLLGLGFMNSNNMKCRLGQKLIQVRFLSDTELICISSDSEKHRPASEPLEISINGVDFINSGVIIHLLQYFTLSSIYPNQGPTSGGTNIFVTGTGFTNSFQYRCLFRSNLVDAVFLNSTRLQCITPYVHHPGFRPLWICIENGDCTDANATFVFLEPLHLLEMYPNQGPFIGDTIVTVKINQNFSTSSYCWFGKKRVKVETETKVGVGICKSPAYRTLVDRATAVDFVVSFDNYQFSQEVLRYIYRPVETLEIPSFGNSSRNTVEKEAYYIERLLVQKITPLVLVRESSPSSLFIEGLNFLTDDGDFLIDFCRVGSYDVPAVFANSTRQIHCDFQEFPEKGSYSVQLICQRCGRSYSSVMKVKIIDGTVLQHLEPAIIIASSQVEVVVKGENFFDYNLTCFFDSEASQGIYVTSSQVICPAPATEMITRSYKLRISNDGNFREAQSFLWLEVLAVPSIAALDPPLGIVGTNVSVIGKSFDPRMQCLMNGNKPLSTQFINSTLVLCSLPFGRYSDMVTISLMYNDAYTSNEQQFTLIDLRIRSVNPTFGSLIGGTPVKLRTKDDTDEIISHCIFGKTIVRSSQTQSGIICTSPSTGEAVSVRLGVSVGGKDFLMSSYTFQYRLPAVFARISPSRGPESGGTSVVLSGKNFVDSSKLSCFFNDTQTLGQYISEEMIVCDSPRLNPGVHEVLVTMNGVDIIETSLSFNVCLKITTTFAIPSFGKTDGDTIISVFGTNFQLGDTYSCHFGNTSVSAVFVRSNLLICTTPPMIMAGKVGLAIQSGCGDNSLVESGFEFYEPFHLTHIRPKYGFLRGGTQVSIEGSNFAQATSPVKCIFNEASVNAVIVSDSEIKCVTPYTSKLGDADTSIVYGSDVFRFASRSFTYEEEIILYDTPVKVVSSVSEKYLTVYGAFIKNRKELVCMLNSIQLVLEATFMSDSAVQCRIPYGLQPSKYELSVSNNGQDFSKAAIDFRIVDPFIIHVMDTILVAYDKFSTISLQGSGFENVEGLACSIDGYIMATIFLNSTLIQCPFPMGVSYGTIAVSLVMDGVTVSNEQSVTLVDLQLNSIQPDFGFFTGGTPVTLSFNNDVNIIASHCIFGSAIVSAFLIDSKFVCESPPVTDIGPVLVGVSTNGKDFSMSPHSFHFCLPATFSSIFPMNGPERGGTYVSLRGEKFVNSNKLLCFFSYTEVPGRWTSENEIICKSPTLKPGEHEVRVSLNGVDVVKTSFHFRSDKEIDVTMAYPSIGLSSGTNTTVMGTSFVLTPHIACQFGDFGIVSASFISSSQLICESPDISQQFSHLVSADIRVSLNGVDFSFSSAQYFIKPPMIIDTISPKKGATSGGTHVFVKGSNFYSTDSDYIQCIFGKTPTSAIILSTKELTCISPSHSRGEVTFSVSMNSGVDRTQVSFFNFLDLPTINNLSIEPRSGPFTGGTLVTVIGDNFDKSSSIKCLFGETTSPNIVFISSQKIQCHSPSHPPGVVPFSIISEDENVKSDSSFKFYMLPQIVSAFPTNGPYRGGTLVKIHGNHIQPDVKYSCHFGQLGSVPGQSITAGSVDCRSPRMSNTNTFQTVVVSVTEQYSNDSFGHVHFTYSSLPTLKYVMPKYFSIHGGENISVHGNYFNSSEMWCRFSMNSSSVITIRAGFADEERADCRVPTYALSTLPIEAFVEVSTNAYDWSASRLSFIYVRNPIIKRILPKLGPTCGGTRITIYGSGFLQDSDLWCKFGVAGSVPAEWQSTSKILCISPPIIKAQNVTVSVQWNGGGEVVTDTECNYTYHREISLEEAYPMRGFVRGGTIVTLIGTGFIDVPTISCHFGSNRVTADFKTPTLIECVSPGVNQSHSAKLMVSLNGEKKNVFSSTVSLIFIYDSEIDIHHIVPDNVAIEAGRSLREHRYIKVMGRSFINTPHLSCLYGKSWITIAYFISEFEVHCLLPDTKEYGDIIISVTLNGIDFSLKNSKISFVPSANILDVFPSKLQDETEISLTVTGHNFIPSVSLQCFFGSASHLWTPALWKSASKLECKTPLLNLTSDGQEYLGISNNEGYDVSKLFPLEITARTRFLYMHPKVGYVLGGTTLSIAISNIQRYRSTDVFCRFGTVAVPATTSNKEITCISPPHPYGKVEVQLLASDTSYSLGKELFEYVQVPQINDFLPRVGVVEGGSRVSIEGSGFDGVTHCRFGNHVVTAIVKSDYQVTCISPGSNKLGDVLLGVTHNGQNFEVSENFFSYRATPYARTISPSYGADSGGKTIVISGYNFSYSPTLTCMFGDLAVDANFISSSMISCATPPLLVGPVSVAVSLNGIDVISDAELIYHAVSVPRITSINPKVGLVNGKTAVMINTTELPVRLRESVACHFGRHAVSATFISRNSLTCTAPPLDSASTVNLTLSVDGQQYFEGREEHSITYTYVAQPEITSISPDFGLSIREVQVSMTIKNLEPFLSFQILCSFGDSSIFFNATQVHLDKIVCVSPKFDKNSMKVSSPITLAIRMGLDSIYIYSPVFNYIVPAIVTRIDPPIGSVNGGALVSLFGINFTNVFGLQCLFGNIAVVAEYVSQQEIRCTSPEYEFGEKEVQVHIGVQIGMRLSNESHVSFKYLPNPIIQSVRPKFGPKNGGTRVVLSLLHPWIDATNHICCRFGYSHLVSAEMLSEKEIVCISTPYEDAVTDFDRDDQRVQIFLYERHGQNLIASSDHFFAYSSNIEIHSIEPSSGPFSGGTVVTMLAKGLNLLPSKELTCHFGDDAIMPVIDLYHESDEFCRIKCKSPYWKGISSTHDVILNLGLNGYQDIPSLGKVYMFYDAPSVTSTFPSAGFFEGGELVRITGTNFLNGKGLGCIFGDKKSPSVILISPNELLCTSPSPRSDLNISRVYIRVTNNGVDFTEEVKTSLYRYIQHPVVTSVMPRIVDWDKTSTVTITGKHLHMVKACRFGDFYGNYPTFNISRELINCNAPPGILLTPFFVPLSPLSVSLEIENGFMSTGFDIRYDQIHKIAANEIDEPHVEAILPDHGTSAGNDWIQVFGKNFSNKKGLRCIFGRSLDQGVRFMSTFQIHCKTPKHVPGKVRFGLTNGRVPVISERFEFSFVSAVSVTSISPTFGSLRGGTVVNVYGLFPVLNDKKFDVFCKFGMNGEVTGDVLSPNHVVCISPRGMIADTVQLSMSIHDKTNFEDSSAWFSYEVESEVETMIPNYGYKDMSSFPVLINGRNFKNVSGLSCIFGQTTVSATFITNEQILCPYPPQVRSVHRVPVSVFIVGDRAAASWKNFDYIDQPTIFSYGPIFTRATLDQGEVTVKGFGFQTALKLLCSFGSSTTKARVVNLSTLLCPIPPHPPGVVTFRLTDQYANVFEAPEGERAAFYFIPDPSTHSIIPARNAIRSGTFNFMRGTNFNSLESVHKQKLTESLALVNNTSFDQSYSVLEPADTLLASNGTIMKTSSAHNLTFCEPGTFQPQRGSAKTCLLCPIGYVCPLTGMSQPILCPAGFICSRLGLVTPNSQCLAGHYCLAGTKMAQPIAQSTSKTWTLDNETGVLTATISGNTWDFILRNEPATGKRRIFHPPIHANVTAQQPFPCPLGHYCRIGVMRMEYLKDDFSSPQLCHHGHFCPRGSIRPEGSGACPTGYYCNTHGLATPCGIGHYCPGTGNTFPLPCFPGSYGSIAGQSNCILCEIGYQCQGWGRSSPEPCKAGFVCDEVGLSIPEKLCPSGSYCEIGTSTANLHSLTGKAPLPCLPGLFCLYGVAQREVSSAIGLPSFNITFPQPCAEGYYCSSNSSTPMGSGSCLPGHYCPIQSPYPIKVPPGTFTGEKGGAIIPSLCLPGTYSSRPGSHSCSPCPAGFSCLSYGTYVPRICGPGTYRSMADSIPCKLCPNRTYSPRSGLTDISQCLPCPEGRVCGDKGLMSLKKSDVCPEGSVCGYVTDRTAQYDYKCPGGSFCRNETTRLSQYSNDCSNGMYCERGAAEKVKTKDKCIKSHFCSKGTSGPERFTTRCPRQTTSTIGSSIMEACEVSHVAMCDKTSFSLVNPFDRNLYYPHEGQGQHDLNGLMVVKKVLPLNERASNIVQWKNDTLEVFRSCPAVEISTSEEIKNKDIVVIGRNFRNATGLSCRFRLCHGSIWTNEIGKELIFPGICRNQTSESVLTDPVITKGEYINENRVSCKMPNFDGWYDYQPTNLSFPIDSQKLICLRDEMGQMFLSQTCSTVDEILSGPCSLEALIPGKNLRRRIYSLFVSCYDWEILSGVCSSIPGFSFKINPCFAHQVIIDVSINGLKFSGDATVVPYTSTTIRRSGSSHSVDEYVINPTAAVYQLIQQDALMGLQPTSNNAIMDLFNASLLSDSLMCSRSSYHQEGRRNMDDGWFLSSYMSRVHLSFDWRHLNTHLVYDKHYKLAIYAAPSRCIELKCEGLENRRREVENSPCLQPMMLPLWFTNSEILKNQLLNITLLSLDDLIFKVEIHIIHGLSIPLADVFKRTMTVEIEHPRRAKTFGEDKVSRKLSLLVSWDEKPVVMPYMFGIRYDKNVSEQISLPLNLPPRWKSLERGRMLLSMNASHENEAPTIKDNVGAEMHRNSDFWSNPYSSATVAKEQSDFYLETFHGVSPGLLDDSFKYSHESLIIPYLPYFSNCREFDSYVPLWAVVESSRECKLPDVTAQYPEEWWRRKIPSLPHQDDVKPIGPYDFMEFYPVADWCERKLYCHFEENLTQVEVTPRWFEAESDATLFSIIRDPIDYHEYTGRDSPTAGTHDGGGQRFIKNTESLQTFIPAKVDRSSAINVIGGCSTACFPRTVALDISYYQVDVHTKRIVQANIILDKFDKDDTNDKYEMIIRFYALNYQELIIKFAFSRGLFILLFMQIGTGTVFAALGYWFCIRLTTKLESPPSLRITGFLMLTFPSAISGFFLGLIPTGIVTAFVFYLLKGFSYFTPDSDPNGRRWLFLPGMQVHYTDSRINPDLLHLTRQGRTGLAFLAIALTSLYFTSQLFVPDRKCKLSPDQISLSEWKRSNLMYSSVIMNLFLVMIIEFSLWESFGKNIWEIIIFMKILSIFVGSIVDIQLGEALLSAPLMTTMSLVQGIVTMSANDFVDFLLSYIVGFGFLIIERMYIEPLQGGVSLWLIQKFSQVWRQGHRFIKINLGSACLDDSSMSSSPKENKDNFEQLLGCCASYSCDILAMFYYPFIMVVMIVFREEVQITKLYGIKEADMEYYVLFALAIIPFQIIADMLMHNSLELLHGVKMYDYLEYCKVRFLQREVWWKGLEHNTLDECVGESFRSLDQLCFSSQYYMLHTIHVNAMIYFVIGVEMMARAKYNLFGDPAMLPIFGAILLCSITVRGVIIAVGRLLGIWRVKSNNRDWHFKLQAENDPNVERLGEIKQAAGYDHYEMEQRITSETFRYKFLHNNRIWLINQLPHILTPRITQRSKPYLIDQLARVLGAINDNLSSDSDNDDIPDYDVTAMSASTRLLLRLWLMKADRLLKLKKIAKPLIQQSRGNECEVCLSRNQLQVETRFSVEEVDKKFIDEYGNLDDQLDQVLWKRFFQRNQIYHTICLSCIQARNKKNNNDTENDINSPVLNPSPSINEVSMSIMAMWYSKAKRQVLLTHEL